jgi:hypothetical protein
MPRRPSSFFDSNFEASMCFQDVLASFLVCTVQAILQDDGNRAFVLGQDQSRWSVDEDEDPKKFWTIAMGALPEGMGDHPLPHLGGAVPSVCARGMRVSLRRLAHAAMQ